MPLVLLGGEGMGGTDGVAQLQAVLVAALIAAQLAPAQAAHAGYTPHLTLLYDDLPLAPRPTDAIIWKAEELLLVRSLLGQSRHELLARLPLRG
jgi:2'-5' RNA ligase